MPTTPAYIVMVSLLVPALIKPGWVTDLAGIALVLVVLAAQWRSARLEVKTGSA